ncbi:putative toxin biosynthesis protein [Rosellinia necatrix]|uniref:Putative toxin biosynthesis protein n=1 Tax=Rosellinia necatrix TaxID=77044 RepID=A0A1W2TAN0_ROSNE|nr:putative toxin biosynthesis protein [Rosellinia necatrix]
MSSFPFHVKEHVVPGQHIREWARGTARRQEDVVRLHVKQYIPKDNPAPGRPGDVTVVGAHANGFPKELYEALWAELHARAPACGFRLRAVWIADVSNQGYSGQLNEAVLGDDPAWHDLSRDLLHLVNVFRADMPRPLVALGHSFGANVLAHLALLHPRLFATLVLLDPTIVVFDPARAVGPGTSPARASTFRRDLWPSRRDAVDAFRRSPFYRSWDPRVLNAWNRHAIRDLPTPLFPELPPAPGSVPAGSEEEQQQQQQQHAGPAVTLRTTKHQEVFTFFRPLYPHITTTPSGSASSPPIYTVSRSGAPDYDPSQVSSGNVDGDGNEDGDGNGGNEPPFAFYRSEGGLVLGALPAVRPSVLFVHGETSDISPPDLRALRVATCGAGPGGSGGAAAGRVAEVLMRARGHLFPMEVPAETAAHAARWIGAEVARWRREQAEYDAWARLPMRQKTTLSQEFIDKVGRPKARPKKVTDPKL